MHRDIHDEVVFHALAMHCFQTVNAAIELGESLVSEKKLGFPSKYKEIFELLFKAKLIGKKTFEQMSRLVYLRNLVAHEYHAITPEELREMTSLLDSLSELVQSAKSK